MDFHWHKDLEASRERRQRVRDHQEQRAICEFFFWALSSCNLSAEKLTITAPGLCNYAFSPHSSSLEANKSKRALQREKAQAKAAASGAAANAIAAPGVPGQGASASAKKKRKAKAKNAAGAVAGNGGMELD